MNSNPENEIDGKIKSYTKYLNKEVRAAPIAILLSAKAIIYASETLRPQTSNGYFNEGQ